MMNTCMPLMFIDIDQQIARVQTKQSIKERKAINRQAEKRRRSCALFAHLFTPDNDLLYSHMWLIQTLDQGTGRVKSGATNSDIRVHTYGSSDSGQVQSYSACVEGVFVCQTYGAEQVM